MYSYLEPTRGGKEWKKMNFDDIVAKVKECGKKTVAVSVAQDSAVLEAVGSNCTFQAALIGKVWFPQTIHHKHSAYQHAKSGYKKPY